MKPQMAESYILYGGEGTISNRALSELLQAVLDKGMPFRFRAPGFSMSPFIRDGDVITISRLSESGDSPGLGTVVAFSQPKTGKLVVHRVVVKKAGYFLIKGDNTPCADCFVPRANVLGYVNKVERNGKHVFIGLGPERFVIAFLSRKQLLVPLLRPLAALLRPFVRLWRQSHFI